MATQKDLNAAFARGFRNQAAPMAAFTAAFDKTIDPVIKRQEREREIARRQKLQEEAEAKQEKNRLDILAANSIGRVGGNYNPEKVPDAMRTSLENLLFTTKQNAGNIALQADAARKQFGANSPEYIDLQTQLSSQKNVFQAANQIALDQQELTDEYVKTRQNVSNGVAISKPGLLNKMQYVLDPNLRNYEMDWTNASDPTYITPEGPIKHSELDDYYSKDSEFATGFQNNATTIYNSGAAGRPLSDPERNAYKADIINSLESGGEARIQSVLHDNLFQGFSLSEGIDAANYEQGINDPRLREDIANQMLGHYDNVSQQGITAYNNKGNVPQPFKPEAIAEAKNVLKLYRSPSEGSLVKGMTGNSNIVFINGNWYPATESGYRVTGASPIASPEAALNRLQIPITLYNQIKDQ
jgi:hypothetical protein